jgi:hypothetical protein
MKTPNFFIVGAPKCGTTSLYSYLRRHPDIFMPSYKEPHYFGRDLYQPNYIRDLDQYLALFASAGDRPHIGEASVWYLYSRSAAKEIHGFCPDARIIVMLRNPVEMIYSYHGQRLYNGTEDCDDFGEALALETVRRSGERIPRRPYPLFGLRYREIAQLDIQLTRYLEIFPREKIHIIVLDDFQRSPKDVCDQAVRFLGAHAIPEMGFSIANASHTFRSAWIRDLVVSPPRVIKVLQRFVPAPVGRHLKPMRILERLNQKAYRRPPMDPDLYRQLQIDFTETIQRLAKLIDVELGHWYRQDPPQNRSP